MNALFDSVLAFVALAAAARAQTEVLTLTGAAAGDEYGTSIAAVGDVDADGFDDFAVGAPGDDTSGADAGSVRVYSGRNLQLLRVWYGPAPGARFGRAIARAGDLDGDLHDDVIVGAPAADAFQFGGSGNGAAYVLSGATGAVLLTYAPLSGPRVGWSVAGGGEIDGDGVPDLLIGDPDASNNSGRVRVVSGATGALLYSVAGSVSSTGWSVAFIGDLDGDGRTEFAVGAPQLAAGTLFDGAAYLVDGASGAILWTGFGAPGFCGDEYGASVARSDDLSGDGLPDVLIGGRDSNCWAGASSGFFDARDGTSGALLFRVSPAAPSFTAYGTAVAALDDLDGDGTPDVAVGGPGSAPAQFGDPCQAVLVRKGANGQALVALPPFTSSDAWGYALVSLDVNHDGLRDLLVGAPLADTNGVDSGAVHVYTIVRAPTVYCASETNSLGCTPSIAGVGTPSATLGSPFDVRATNVLNNKSGLCFYGFKPRQTPFQGGHMCVVAPTVRTPIQSSAGAAPPASDCSGVLTLDFNARIQSGVDPLLAPGKQVFAQYWSRDPQDASTTNLTDALAFYVNP
jgi:hypothetical protein